VNAFLFASIRTMIQESHVKADCSVRLASLFKRADQ
jgi:hypothetical protein